MISVSKRKLVSSNNKNYIPSINSTSISSEEILTSLEMLCFCIPIAIFARSISLTMMSSEFISTWNILLVMFVLLWRNIDITKIISTWKHISKCHITFVMKRIVLTKNSLLLRLPMSSSSTECKFMKNKTEKLMSNNYVAFSMRDKTLMIK